MEIYKNIINIFKFQKITFIIFYYKILNIIKKIALNISFMIYIFSRIIVIILLIIILIRCNKTVDKTSIIENDEQYNEYLEHYIPALSSLADDNTLLSTITYIDDLIEKGKHEKIKDIYYDKAKLLYKLKKYDDALNTLYQSDESYYNIYIATLLIRLKQEDKAIPILENIISTNKKGLIETQMPEQKRKFILQGTMACYILADKTREEILLDMTNENISKKQDVDLFLQEMLTQDDIIMTKEDILLSMWPEKGTIP
jgi:tetratricopeptide (TPR) repeat protein